MTFKKWLLAFVNDDTDIGDLARDIRDDVSFPAGARSSKTIQEYFANAPHPVRATVEEALKRYQT